jgi:cytidyltransferase-like protein
LGQVVSQGELDLYRGEWKRAGKGVLCPSGTSDLLHPGHVRLLEQARSLGDVLIVAISSDAGLRAGSVADEATSISETPAEGLGNSAPARPVVPAAERTEILGALDAVDYLVEFDESSSHEFLARFLPDLFVKGSSAKSDKFAFTAETELDVREIENLGCKVVCIPLEPGRSTTRLIQRILGIRA